MAKEQAAAGWTRGNEGAGEEAVEDASEDASGDACEMSEDGEDDVEEGPLSGEDGEVEEPGGEDLGEEVQVEVEDEHAAADPPGARALTCASHSRPHERLFGVGGVFFSSSSGSEDGSGGVSVVAPHEDLHEMLARKEVEKLENVAMKVRVESQVDRLFDNGVHIHPWLRARFAPTSSSQPEHPAIAEQPAGPSPPLSDYQ